MSAESGSAKSSGKNVARKPKPKNGGGRSRTAVEGTVVEPTSPAAIEKAIADRRVHLAATIDELTFRTKPAEIARRSLAGVQAKVRTITHTPEGELRTERLAAAGGAVAVLTGVLIYLRRRK